MTLLPIVGRELRVAARELRQYWSRVVSALLALLLGVFVFTSFGYSNLSTQGLMMFIALAWLAWLFCLTAGARLTADAISSERREGTLGLLFLTDLRGYDIVLGKLAANSLNSLYGLLAIVPVLALPLLMGGVALEQVWRVVVVLLATLFFSLSAGMFVSCWFENGRRALGGTLLILVTVTLGPFGVMLLPLLGNGRGPSQPDFWVAIPSPLLAQALAATPSGPGKPDEFFWPSVICVVGLGLVLLAAACAVLPRLWRSLPRLLPARPARAHAAAGPVDRRKLAHRRRLLEVNPFYWLTCRSPRSSWRVGFVFLGLALLWVWVTTAAEMWRDSGWAISTALLLHVVFKVWIAVAAVQQLAEERRTGSMELLLCTPLSVREIVVGQMRALARRFGPAFALVLLADLFLLLNARTHAYSDRPLLGVLGVGHLAALGVDSVAIALLGMWSALRTRHANQASGSAFFRVIALPCIAFFALGIVADLLNLDRRWSMNLSEKEVALSFYLLCLVNDLFWAGYAWDRLHRRFREVAAQRFERGGGLFSRWRRA